jgi:hypothetical protein
MIAAASVLSLLLGTTLACAAERVPSQIAAMENGGGALLLAGLAMIGWGLPFAS